MHRLIRTVLALIGVCGIVAVGRADPATKEDRLKAVKEACVVLELQGGPNSGQDLRWSAFAIGRGYFITATGTEFGAAAGSKVWITLHPGEKAQMRSEGTVVRTDAMAGLILVRAKGVPELPALTLGDVDKVSELEDLTAFGAPAVDYSKLLLFNDDGQRVLPPMSLAQVKVSVARLVLDADKKLIRFTLGKPGVKDKLVIGGPAVNENGEVVGLVAREEPNAPSFPDAGGAPGVVLTMRAVNQFLAVAPIVEFDPLEIDPKAKFEKSAVKAGLFAGIGQTEGFTVELIMRSGGRERKAEMKQTRDGFEANMAPFEKSDQPDLLVAEVAFPDSRPRLPVADATFQVGGKEFRLSDVTRVRFGKGGGVNTLSGPVDGEVMGLEGLAVRTGGQAFSVKLASATELAVRLQSEPKNSYRMTAIAKKDGKVVSRAEIVRFLKGTTPAGLEGLRSGYLVKPTLGDAPKTFTRILVSGDDEPQEFTAERMPLVVMPGLDEKGQRGIGGVRLSLLSLGWKPLQPGEPLRPDPFFPLFEVQLNAPLRKLIVPGEWQMAGNGQHPIMPQLWVTGSGLPMLGRTGGGLAEPSPASASFAVYELEADTDGKTTKFAADFIFNAPGRSDKPVVGVIRFNSKFQ